MTIEKNQRKLFIAYRNSSAVLLHSAFYKIALNSPCTTKYCSKQLSKVFSGKWDSFSPKQSEPVAEMHH